MKTIRIILLILIIIGLGLLGSQKLWVNPLVNFILKQDGETIVKSDLLSMTFTISGQSYTLIDGKAEKEIAPGSASKDIVRIFGEPVYGDFNGDGIKDAAVFVVQTNGGSGTFFYIVEAINDNGVFKGTNAMLLGDRIAPQNITIDGNRAVANFAERRAGEPMTDQPSIGKSVWVQYDKNTGQIGEWVKDFEGESSVVK